MPEPDSPDYDCAGSGDGPDYTGPVQVVGDDPHGLDRDGGRETRSAGTDRLPAWGTKTWPAGARCSSAMEN